jgi:hypothetical protein
MFDRSTYPTSGRTQSRGATPVPLIRDPIAIPERVYQGDFVLRLTKGVTQPEQTLRDYVATRGGNAAVRLHPHEVSRVARDTDASQRSAAWLWARAATSRNITLLEMAPHPDVEYLAPDANDDAVGRTAVVDLREHTRPGPHAMET